MGRLQPPPTRDQIEKSCTRDVAGRLSSPLSYWELEEAGIDFDLKGTRDQAGRRHKHVAKPVWAYLEESVKECTTEWCQEKTGLDPALVEEACLAWATRPEGQTYGNGGIHLNLAPDQVGNCAQTVRAVLHLSYMTGNFDGPAGNRGPDPHAGRRRATAAPRRQHAAGGR